MNRILFAVFLGMIFSSFTFGQQPLKDTTAVADTSHRKLDSTLVTARPALTRPDSLSLPSKDTSLVRKDTISQIPLGVTDSVTARKDSSVQELPKSVSAEVKTPALKNSLMDPNGYKDVHWGMTLRDTKDYLVDHDNVDEYEIRSLTNGFEYAGTVATVKATLAYQFDNDRLYIVRLAPRVAAVSRFDFFRFL